MKKILSSYGSTIQFSISISSEHSNTQWSSILVSNISALSELTTVSNERTKNLVVCLLVCRSASGGMHTSTHIVRTHSNEHISLDFAGIVRRILVGQFPIEMERIWRLIFITKKQRVQHSYPDLIWSLRNHCKKESTERNWDTRLWNSLVWISNDDQNVEKGREISS